MPVADLSELNLPSNISITFPEGRDKSMHFEITIKPDEGFYRYSNFQFSCDTTSLSSIWLGGIDRRMFHAGMGRSSLIL